MPEHRVLERVLSNGTVVRLVLEPQADGMVRIVRFERRGRARTRLRAQAGVGGPRRALRGAPAGRLLLRFAVSRTSLMAHR